jgi:cytochrome c oxidase assembly factor CtaG
VLDPVGLLAVTIPSCAYLLGLQRIWRQAGRGRLVSVTQARYFGAGMVCDAVALCSPLAGLAERSVAGHMVQHVVLLGVSGPLIGSGAPLPTLIWSLPASARRPLLRWWRRTASSLAGAGYLRWLVGTLAVQVGVMIGWHVPVLFDTAVHNRVVHGAEHLSFVVSAAALWWVLNGGHRRADQGHGVMALFAASLAGIALGGALTFAGHPWYRPYGTGPAALGSQQLAGVVMWSFGGIIVLAGALRLVHRLLSDGDDEPGSAATPRPEGVQNGRHQAGYADRATEHDHAS